MILVDANILLYAEDESSPFNTGARQWWDSQLSASTPVCLCWEVITAFIRIGSNPRVFQQPLSIEEATSRVESWLLQPCVRLIAPTSRHWSLFQQLLTAGKATGNLVMDAHLAALAIEHGCALYSTDADFSRFPRLRWKNPLRS